MGPLSSELAAAAVIEQIEDAVAHGARALVGGHRIARERAFIAPTVLVDVPDSARAHREEVFGPVAVVHRVNDLDDAVTLANDTPFGLGSVVLGGDADALSAVADRLDVGMVAVDGASMTQPDTPFGGVKASGFGRELGECGLFEVANRKFDPGSGCVNRESTGGRFWTPRLQNCATPCRPPQRLLRSRSTSSRVSADR